MTGRNLGYMNHEQARRTMNLLLQHGIISSAFPMGDGVAHVMVDYDEDADKAREIIAQEAK